MIQLLINFYRVRNTVQDGRSEGKRNKISRVALVAFGAERFFSYVYKPRTYLQIHIDTYVYRLLFGIYIRNARVNHLTFYRLNFVALVSRLAVGYTCAIFTSGNPRQPSLRNLRKPSVSR